MAQLSSARLESPPKSQRAREVLVSPVVLKACGSTRARLWVEEDHGDRTSEGTLLQDKKRLWLKKKMYINRSCSVELGGSGLGPQVFLNLKLPHVSSLQECLLLQVSAHNTTKYSHC